MHNRILFDIDSVIPFFTRGHATGVGRSTFELVKALNELQDTSVDIVLYSQNVKGIGVRNLHYAFKSLHIYLPRRKWISRIINFFHIKRLLSGYDLMHVPHNTDDSETIGRTIYTIHDLIVYRYPEMWGLTDKERSEHKFIADNCKAIVTCSEASKEDIRKFWNCSPEKITAIPWGVNRNVFHPDMSSIDEIDGCKEGEFFFSSSSNHERKRTPLMLKAFRRYRNMGGRTKMILLSPIVKDLAGYDDMMESGELIIVRNINDTLLVKLYSHAKATIVVSLYEGFGLPVLESLACHTPVICARNSSLIEAGGDVVDFIDEPDEISLSDKMFRYDILSKKDTMDIDRVERHLENFTWEKCAKRYLEFWKQQLEFGE